MTDPRAVSDMVSTCQQCFQDYEPGSFNDGFCGDDCLKQYEKEVDDYRRARDAMKDGLKPYEDTEEEG